MPRKTPPSKKQAQKAAMVLTAAAPKTYLRAPDQEASSAAGRALRARRTMKMTAPERTALASHAAKAYWAGMSEAEKKIEIKRRVSVRKKRRLEARKAKIRAGK